jgi:RimJ/RimL family protein N-acetyltransferase
MPGVRGLEAADVRFVVVTTRFDELRTERLLMRRWRDSDRDPFAAMNADPEVMRHFPSLMDRARSDAFVDLIDERFETQGFGLWALELAETGEFLGYTGLNPMPDGVPGAGDMEIAWRLARAAWGHGYATEAARAGVHVAFGGAGLARIWSMTAVTNTASQAVMRRIGMTLHGHFDHPRIPADSPVRPHVIYRLDRPGRPKTPLGS